ncbi:hypothetical protein PLESTF_000427900 [Pleodorina starrii]|nr:hypothetical protein PLESTM_001465300 [Pleodorina starrii]GLC66443.1 hypothetical protein PLESTF_000427900 [Pleodorina starrii]
MSGPESLATTDTGHSALPVYGPVIAVLVVALSLLLSMLANNNCPWVRDAFAKRLARLWRGCGRFCCCCCGGGRSEPSRTASAGCGRRASAATGGGSMNDNDDCKTFFASNTRWFGFEEAEDDIDPKGHDVLGLHVLPAAAGAVEERGEGEPRAGKDRNETDPWVSDDARVLRSPNRYTSSAKSWMKASSGRTSIATRVSVGALSSPSIPVRGSTAADTAAAATHPAGGDGSAPAAAAVGSGYGDGRQGEKPAGGTAEEMATGGLDHEGRKEAAGTAGSGSGSGSARRECGPAAMACVGRSRRSRRQLVPREVLPSEFWAFDVLDPAHLVTSYWGPPFLLLLVHCCTALYLVADLIVERLTTSWGLGPWWLTYFTNWTLTLQCTAGALAALNTARCMRLLAPSAPRPDNSPSRRTTWGTSLMAPEPARDGGDGGGGCCIWGGKGSSRRAKSEVVDGSFVHVDLEAGEAAAGAALGAVMTSGGGRLGSREVEKGPGADAGGAAGGGDGGGDGGGSGGGDVSCEAGVVHRPLGVAAAAGLEPPVVAGCELSGDGPTPPESNAASSNTGPFTGSGGGSSSNSRSGSKAAKWTSKYEQESPRCGSSPPSRQTPAAASTEPEHYTATRLNDYDSASAGGTQLKVRLLPEVMRHG